MFWVGVKVTHGYITNMEFHLTPAQVQHYKTWKQQFMDRSINYGAIGGAFKFVFIPTTIGTIVKVQFDCDGIKEELDLTDYSEW
jgi:hypothetical protein